MTTQAKANTRASGAARRGLGSRGQVGRSRRPGRSRLAAVSGLAAATVMALAACGAEDADAGSGGPSISISEPADGATVTQPFTMQVEASVEIGETDTGKDHFHLSFDGKEEDYTVEPDGEVRVDSLTPGEHSIKVTLQHADHSPVGPEDEITVTVQGEGQGTTGDSGGGLGY